MKTTQPILKVFALLLCLLAVKTSFAQNVGISSTSGFTPDASAALDVSYTSKGLLIPRVALTAANAAGPIASPATSLLVYNTATAGTSPNNVTPGYYYWNGAAWTGLSTATSGWALTGNTGVAPGTNFLGTLDLNSVRVKTNKIQRFLVDSLGSVSVGLAPAYTSGSAREKFLVDGGTSAFPTPTGAFNIISGKGYLDSYIQLNIQNTSPTAAASSDIVASNDQATESVNFIDMGINSSAYSGTTTTGVTAGPNTAYLYATGNDFSIGNATAGKNLLFFTGGTGTNERMRIDGTGNVGIGNTAPAQVLDVTGNINSSGSVYVDGANSNTGAKTPGLFFGGSTSGETIASKRTTGGNQYGLDFYTSSILRMSVTTGGNVGINISAPTSTLAINGSIAANVTGKTSNYTLTTSDYILINTSTAATGPTFTLPAASTCFGRMYRIINHGTQSITISPNVISANGSTVNSLATAAGSNVMEVVSDGNNWRRINQ